MFRRTLARSEVVLLYVSGPEDLGKSIGVRKKVYSQAKTFLRYCAETISVVENVDGQTRLTILSKNGQKSSEWVLFKSKNSLSKVFYYKSLFKASDEIIQIDKDRKIAYLRCTIYDIYLAKFMRKLKEHGYTLIVEIPTATFIEEYLRNLPKGWYKLLTYILHSTTIYQLSDIIVSIGEMSKALKGFEEKVVVTTNGIDLSEIPVTDPPSCEQQINLIGVGTVSYWHGYDRIITGLAKYYESFPNVKVYFHIVGEGSEVPKLKKLANQLGVSEYVIFHGKKIGAELDKVFHQCHVGVGSLGNHRKRMDKTSELKIRDYCARGLPFMYATHDPDIPEDFPFGLKLESTDEPVDMHKVVSFYQKIRVSYPEYPKLMRAYAERHLTWDVKLRPVIDKVLALNSERNEQ